MDGKDYRYVDELLSAGRFFNICYRDEPIKLKSKYISEGFPPMLCEARLMGKKKDGRVLSREQLFYQQALFLADYEDNFVYDKEVIRYYPTYQSLNDKELRAYFSWRTKWRKGDHQETSLSFAFIYIYELLHLVGCSDALDGFNKLKSFSHDYATFDPVINRYLKKWLLDFIVYYDLDPALLEDTEETQEDEALFVLSKIRNSSDTEVFQAILKLAGTTLEKSRFYKKYPKMTEKVVAGTFRQIDSHYAKHCMTTWIETCFGKSWRYHIWFFNGAVFYYRPPKTKSRKEISPLCYYECIDEKWFKCNHEYDPSSQKKFLNLIRTIDSQLRDSTGFPYPIQQKVKTKWIITAIKEEIQNWLDKEAREKAEAERKKRELNLDLSQLGNIRSDATETRDKLLTEEEIAAENTEILENAVEEAEILENTGFDSLSPQEKRYLKCLLENTPTNWLASEGLLPSLICDSINEKLYDIFSDTVLENGELVEDYKNEIKDNI